MPARADAASPASFLHPPVKKEEEEIKKTEDDISKIKEILFSATSLQTYFACPAKFYYRYVQKLTPEGEVKETLDPSLEGTVCHEVLKEIYAPEGRIVDEAYLIGWLKRRDEIKQMVLEHIRKELKSVDVDGQDLVTSDVLVKFITRVLECDIKQIRANGPITIIGLEKKMYARICGHQFQGVIDRLDKSREGMVRVVDYKTGKDTEDVLARCMR